MPFYKDDTLHGKITYFFVLILLLKGWHLNIIYDIHIFLFVDCLNVRHVIKNRLIVL